jgi:hypothetical protein
LAQHLFRQQVVEVPLDRTMGATVGMPRLRAWQGRSQVEAVGRFRPSLLVLEHPQVISFGQGAHRHVVDEDA